MVNNALESPYKVTLKNGKTFKGEELEEDENYIILKTDTKMIKIKKENISVIECQK